MALGLSLNHYVMSLFAPELIAAFGWTRAQYALVGATPFVAIFLIPLGGRLTDRVGPRAAAAIGFTALPLGYLALSVMNGSFALFLTIILLKSLFGTLTTTMVFARVIVERFDRARGFALSIVMSAAPLMGAIAVPLVAGVIDDHGWRIAFRVLAAISALGGLLTFALMGGRKAAAEHNAREKHAFSRQDVARFFKSPLFLFAVGGMLLVNIPQLLVASQMKLVLAENGAVGSVATWIISLYAAGVAGGRVLCGVALDRFSVQHVAISVLGLPAIGLAAMATSYDATWVLAGSILLMALAQGAEGDIGAYLISRKFPLRNYSLIASFMTVALTLGGALGSVILSYSLKKTDTYSAFLLVSAAATLIGAFLFYLTGRYPAQADVMPDVHPVSTTR